MAADPSVATIRNNNLAGFTENRGTGFVVKTFKNSSLLATNYHVCLTNYVKHMKIKEPAKSGIIVVSFSDKTRASGKVIHTSPDYDLCLIRIKGRRPIKTLAMAPELAPNEPLEVIGAPGHPNVKLSFTGPDNTFDKWSKGHKDSWLAKGFAEGGYSGSPIVNSKGLVVGIMWGNISSIKSTVFVHVKTLKKFINERRR